MSDDLTETFYLTALERQRKQPRTDAEDRLWLAIRQACIMVIGAIEDYRGMERSIEPKHKR